MTMLEFGLVVLLAVVLMLTWTRLTWRESRAIGILLLLFLVWILFGSRLHAQTIANPGTAIFTASADHNATELGTAVLTDYAIEFVNSSNAVAQSITIGKPAPVGNEITVDLTALRPKFTMTPGTYTLRVVARGPGGSNLSTPSDPFTLTPRAPGAPGRPRTVASSASLLRIGPWSGAFATGAVESFGRTSSGSGSDEAPRAPR